MTRAPIAMRLKLIPEVLPAALCDKLARCFQTVRGNLGDRQSSAGVRAVFFISVYTLLLGIFFHAVSLGLVPITLTRVREPADRYAAGVRLWALPS